MKPGKSGHYNDGERREERRGEEGRGKGRCGLHHREGEIAMTGERAVQVDGGSEVNVLRRAVQRKCGRQARLTRYAHHDYTIHGWMVGYSSLCLSLWM